MIRMLSLAVLGLACAATPAAAQQAQLPPFEELIYLSCSDAQAKGPAERVAVARHLADRAAAHYGIVLGNDDTVGRELGILIRGGCTMFPQALLFGVIAQAVKVEAARLTVAR